MTRKLFRVAGNFLYLLLNLFLILICILVPFYYSVIALTKPKTITTVIQNIDYKALVKKTPTVEKALESYGIDYKKADEIMKSKEAGELIEVYADETTEILLSLPENRKIHTSHIKNMINDNIGDFLTVAEETTDIEFDEKEVETAVNEYVEENEGELKSFVPALEQIHTVVKQIKMSQIVARTRSLPFVIAFTAVILGIALIIVLIKRRKLKGVLFLGVDFAVISLALGLTVFFCRSSFVTALALEMSDFGVSIIESAVSVCTDGIITAAIISAVLAVLAIMLFGALRYGGANPHKSTNAPTQTISLAVEQ